MLPDCTAAFEDSHCRCSTRSSILNAPAGNSSAKSRRSYIRSTRGKTMCACIPYRPLRSCGCSGAEGFRPGSGSSRPLASVPTTCCTGGQIRLGLDQEAPATRPFVRSLRDSRDFPQPPFQAIDLKAEFSVCSQNDFPDEEGITTRQMQ